VTAVSDADTRRARIKDRIAASQDRMRRSSVNLPAVPKRETLPDAYPPEDYRSLAREYPWLTVAAGAGLGLLAGALLPKRLGGKLGKRALGVASVAAELGLALSRQAGSKAAEGLTQLEESTAPLRQRAGRAAGSARSGTRSAGVALAREAIRLAARVRK
jgi:ElaB/YqjD/DUF883 family membrane-anchored ribosome-binding protein